MMSRDWLDTLKYYVPHLVIENLKIDGAWYEKFMKFK